MIKDSKVLILGITFKENCPDVSSRYYQRDGCVDPWADNKEYSFDDYQAMSIKISNDDILPNADGRL